MTNQIQKIAITTERGTISLSGEQAVKWDDFIRKLLLSAFKHGPDFDMSEFVDLKWVEEQPTRFKKFANGLRFSDSKGLVKRIRGDNEK